MASQILRAPLWFADGARYDRIDARLMPDGALQVKRHTMGAGDNAAWGADDEEITLRLAPRDIARLALALLREHHGGDADALTMLQALCERHDIPTTLSAWT